jgi:AraC-like DNA-binding protein
MTISDSVFVYRLSGGDRLSWHGRYHAHGASEFEIHFFLEGSGSFLCNRTRYPVSGGRLFLTGPREFHSIVPEAVSAPLTYYAILFSLDEAGDAGDARLSFDLVHALSGRNTVLSIDNNFRFQFEDLLQMIRSADPALQEASRHLLASFLFRWFGKRASSAPVAGTSGADMGKNNRLHVEKALSLMEKEVRENIKIQDIAWKIGLSDEHFIRIFRAEVRMTPHQYFTRLKIEGASGLLMSTDKSVGEISAWFGFENQFHFSRIFKKCTGMSPVVYRRTFLQTVDFI